MLLLEAVEAMQPVVERAGLKGDLAEAVQSLKYKSRGVISSHIQFKWSKADALAVNLVLDALTALAEVVVNTPSSQALPQLGEGNGLRQAHTAE